MSADRLAAARDLLERAKSDPLVVLEESRQFAEAARSAGEHAAAAIALTAAGDASRFVEGMPASIGYLGEAIAEARVAGDRAVEATAQLSMAGSQGFAGDLAGALVTLDAAEIGADELMAARIGFQRGFVLSRAARYEEAIAAYGATIPVFERNRDRRFEAMARKNRGFLNAFAGAHDAAEADLLVARRLFVRLGLDAEVAYTDHNLGVVAAYRGDLPAALARFDDSEARLLRLTGDVAEVQVSRCEALLSAGLFADAMSLAREIREQMRRLGLGIDEAEAALVEAQAALLAGETAQAARAAAEAGELLDHQDRPGWQAQADLIEVQATAGASRSLRRRARRIAVALQDSGQVIPATNARLLAARLGIALGDLDGAASDLARASSTDRGGPVELRIAARLGTALLRNAQGDARGADAAARAGIRLLDAHQAALGATDVRVGVARHAEHLGELGLRLAVDSGEPRRLWAWMERTRAGALRFRPVRPPDDEELAAELAVLRRVGEELRLASGDDAGRLLTRQRRLQESVRRRTHHAAGTGGTVTLLTAADLLSRLGQVELVELAVIDDRVLAVIAGSGRMRIGDLGPSAAIDESAAAVRLAVGRLGRSPSASNVDLVEQALHRLEAVLVGPLRLGEGPLVVVPPGGLLAIPWGWLPSLRGRAVVICPSASLWMRAAGPGRSVGRTVLVAGPGLEFASSEVRRLADLYPRAIRFNSRRSRTADVLSAMNGATVAHVASHGVFRADNPLFSSLVMADGDLTVFDIEGLVAAPELMVLSACESGISAVRPGDELLGLSAALLAMGTRTLVAGIGLVPDTLATRRLVHLFHRALAAGTPPAAALAAARLGVANTPDGYAAASAFSAFGAG